MGEAALAVIGQDHHIKIRQQRLKLVQFIRQHCVPRAGLKIHAQQLLLATDDAQLGGGFEIRIGPQSHTKGLGVKQRRQRCARLVLPDYRQQADLRAQCGGIARHIARAANAVLGARHMHDGHRCFGRDARHFAEPIAVQHQVAHD